MEVNLEGWQELLEKIKRQRNCTTEEAGKLLAEAVRKAIAEQRIHVLGQEGIQTDANTSD